MNSNAESYIHELEKILEKQVKDSYPRYWDENTITNNILRDIETNLAIVHVQGLRRRIQIEWKAFKLRGKLENKFGDIACLINISYQDGDKLEGVAFLEAKKRERNRTKFEAMKNAQLLRIRKHAPSSMALLYDYEDITQFADNGIYTQTWKWLVRKPCTCSVTVPINTILSTQKKDMTLYKFSIPFSHQLFFRYFQGFDLEFHELPIKIAKGYATNIGIPTYLVVVSVGIGKTERISDLSFNRDIFKGISNE